MTTEVIRYKILAGQAAAFEEAYRKAEPILQNSPHCLGYRLLQSFEEPGNWILMIHWQSVDGHEQGFGRQKDLRAFFALVKPFLDQIEEVKHYHQTELSWSREFQL